MTAPRQYSSQAKIAELEREIRFRYDVYGRLVAKGKMKPEVRDYQIGVMLAILDDYRAHGRTLDHLNAADPSSAESP